MKAVVWHGDEDVRVESVDDPRIEAPTDAIVRITSTAICGSDLHLYGSKVLGMQEGDILGHEPMGIVEEVGAEVTSVAPGDRVVVPFNISCGRCYMCETGLQSQCETTQNTDKKKGASLYGYTHLYGGVPGGQAEYLRAQQAHYSLIKIPNGGTPDDRFLFLSDVLPTAWQAVTYADTPQGGTLAIYGLGPIGQMCVRIARHQSVERVLALDDHRRLHRPGPDLAARRALRPADPGPHGTGERQALGARDTAAPYGRRPARRGAPDDAPRAARAGTRRILDVPQQGRRRDQGRAQTLKGDAMADDRREPTKKETEKREEEERERDEPKENEPWAKVNSGDTESMTSD